MNGSADTDAPRPVAVFDLDGTLTRTDTFLPFLATFAVRRRRPRPLLILPVVVGLYLARLLKDRTAKELLIRAFCGGRPIAEIDAHASWFVASWIPGRLRPEIVAELRRHRDLGLRTVLLSASPDLYVPAIARALDVDEVLCTRVGREDGRCTGRLDGPNCKGSEKIEAMRRLLGAADAPPGSVAYGDSPSDLPLLRWVDRGYLVAGRRTARCLLVAKGAAPGPAPNVRGAGSPARPPHPRVDLSQRLADDATEDPHPTPQPEKLGPNSPSRPKA